MKNEVSEKIFRRAILSLITLTFLSSSTVGLAESAVKGDVSTQSSSLQVIDNKAPQQKNIGAITSGAALNGQNSSPKAVPPLIRSSTVRSLISRFESFVTQTMDSVRTAILPNIVGRTQRSVRKTVNPIETEKNEPVPAMSPQGITLSIEGPTSRVAEVMGSILVSKPFVDQIVDGKGSLQIPSPVIGTPTIISDPATVQGMPLMQLMH